MIDFFVELINYLIEGIGIALGWVVSLFPDSPFGEPASPPSSVNLGWITWLIDFPTMIVHATALTGVILIYYAYRVAARWLKVVKE